MKDHRRLKFAVTMLVAMAPALATNLAGEYVGVDMPDLRLRLAESGDGHVTGTLSEDGADVMIEGRRQGNGFTGTASPQGETLPVTGRPCGT